MSKQPVASNSTTAHLQGAYGEKNFGDDALLAACAAILSQLESKHRISHRSHGSEYCSNLIAARGLSITDHSPDECELLIYGGGTQFFSFRKPVATAAWDMSRAIFRRLPWRRPHRSARLPAAAKTIALGIGLGPFQGAGFRERAVRDHLRRFDFVAVRDSESLQICQSWGVHHATLGADLAFLPGLGLWNTDRSPTVARGGANVGIIVRDWHHTTAGRKCIRPIFQVAECLRKQGKRVQFVLFRPATGANAEAAWAKQLKRAGENVLCWQPTTMSIAEFLTQLKQFDCVITARYHGAVFASLLEIPSVLIEIEPKLTRLADMLSTGAKLWPQPFNPVNCLTSVNELLDNLTAAKTALRYVVASQSLQATAMVDRLFAFLGEDRYTSADNTPASFHSNDMIHLSSRSRFADNVKNRLAHDASRLSE